MSWSSIEQLDPDRFRITGYAPESAVSELEARGCEVQVLMDTQAMDQFHGEVARMVASPDDDNPPAAGV